MLTRSTLFQFLRFAAVGVVGFVTDAAIVEALKGTVGPMVAQLAAFPVATTVTWGLNRRFTFGARRRPSLREWLHYVLANLSGWTANNGVYALFVLKLETAHQYPALAVAAGSIAGMFLNFSASRLLVYRPERKAAG